MEARIYSVKDDNNLDAEALVSFARCDNNYPGTEAIVSSVRYDCNNHGVEAGKFSKVQ